MAMTNAKITIKAILIKRINIMVTPIIKTRRTIVVTPLLEGTLAMSTQVSEDKRVITPTINITTMTKQVTTKETTRKMKMKKERVIM